MTAFPAGEEQREFQYKSDCEIYTGTLHADAGFASNNPLYIEPQLQTRDQSSA